MNKTKTIAFLIIIFIGKLLFLVYPSQASAAFRFVSWADTKSARSRLRNISNEMIRLNLNPVFTIYPGDLESDGFTSNGMANWKCAINGCPDNCSNSDSCNNGVFDITFPTRGNHDTHVSGSTSDWQAYFNMKATAQRIGATNYKYQGDNLAYDDLTYSFDYQNSRFIGIDVDGGVGGINSGQTSWLDQRLTDAERNSSITHAFIFFHGPIYWIANHQSNPPSHLISVLNSHPIISATFHGHEHLYAWTHIDRSRISGMTNHEFEQFVTGSAGAGPTYPNTSRVDWFMDQSVNAAFNGLTLIDVNGSNYSVSFYKLTKTTPTKLQYVKTYQCSKSSRCTDGSPPPTDTPGPTATPTTGCAGPGDVNCNGTVNATDLRLVLKAWGRNLTSREDAHPDGKINLYDAAVVVGNWS